MRRFRGARWERVRDPDAVAFRLNTYRVLLTRARYATIVFVPRGDPDDPTRDPATYDGIARFLVDCGLGPLEAVASGAGDRTGANGLPDLFTAEECPDPCAS